MSRTVLRAAKCSQMDNPAAGTGTGGNRCTEAVNAMIAWTYNLGAVVSQWKTPEEVMYEFTRERNGGRTVSSLRDPQEVVDWVNQHGPRLGVSMRDLPASFASIMALVDRGHCALAQLGDYINLRLVGGASPYPWSAPHGQEHVLLVVGYDTDKQALIVHDPLRADPLGQPADYTWASFQAARISRLVEVVGKPLPVVTQTGAAPVNIPKGWKDDGEKLTAPNGISLETGQRKWVLSHAPWPPENVPLAPTYRKTPITPADPALGGGVRTDFLYCSVGWTAAKQAEFLLPVGKELVALRAQVAQLEEQLKQAKERQALDVAALRADAAAIAAALSPLAALAQPVQAAVQAVEDMQQKLGS